MNPSPIFAAAILVSIVWLAGAPRESLAGPNEAGEVESARLGWGQIARDLELKHRASPGDLTVLHNLIVAYTRLSALERGTARGENLCDLIPERIEQFRQAAGAVSSADAAGLQQCADFLAFQMGLYPLLAREPGLPPADDHSAWLRRALQALGQAEFHSRPDLVVNCGAVPLRLRVWSLPAPNAAQGAGSLFHHYFLPAIDESRAVPRFWMTLASQQVGNTRRFYLYGHQGQQRKPLKLYGTREPGYEEVVEDVSAVLAVMAGDMFQQRGATLGGRALVLILLAGAVLALVAVRIARRGWRRRRTAQVSGLLLPVVVVGTAVAAAVTWAQPADIAERGSERLEFPPEATAFVDEVGSQLQQAGISLSPSLPEDIPQRPGIDEARPMPAAPAVDPLPWAVPSAPRPAPIEPPPPLPDDPQRRLAHQFAVIHEVQTRVARAIESRQISEELGLDLQEKLRGWKIAQEKLQGSTFHKLDVEYSFPELIAGYQAGMSATGGTAPGPVPASSKAAPPREAAAGLLQQVFEGTRRSPASTPVTVKPAYSMNLFNIKPEDMDDATPLVSRYNPNRIEVPLPQGPDIPEANLVVKGVKILIDEDLLRAVLAHQGWEPGLNEMAALEDALLGSQTLADAEQALNVYTSAQQQRFFETARRSHAAIDKPVLVRLGPILQQLQRYTDRWQDRPQALRTVGELTSIRGYMLDPGRQDVWLIGERAPGRPPISVDCLIVGLQQIWREGRTPVCSLDSAPSALAGVQRSRLMDVPRDSQFGRIMLDADYAMKRIFFRDDELGIAGFEPLGRVLRELTERGAISGHNRFWLTAEQPGDRSILLGPYGLSALFQIRVRVETEEMLVAGDDASGVGRASELRAGDAVSFTDHFQQIADRRPIFRDLENLYQIAMLAKLLRQIAPADHPILSGLAALPYEHVQVPATYPGLRLEHRRGDFVLEIAGGCDLNPRLSTRALLQAASPSHDALVAAVASAGQSSPAVSLGSRALSLPGAGGDTRDESSDYLAAIQLLAGENWSEARDAFTRLLDRSPRWAELHERRALTRWHLGDWRGALGDAAMAIRLEPDEPEFRATWFYLRLEGGDERALRELTPALRELLSNRYVARGDSDAFEHRRPQRAQAAFDRALQLDPRQTAALFFRGTWRLKNMEYAEALSDFDAALQIEPGDTLVRCLRGSARSRLGDQDGALADFDQVIQDSPDQFFGWAFRADLRGRLEDFAGAIQDATRAIELRPTRAESYVTRGSARAALADARPDAPASLWRGAKEDLERALELFPEEEPMRPGIESLLLEIQQRLR